MDSLQDNIGLFKLVSGEEIVSKYQESLNIFTLTAARAILLGRTTQGLTLQLGPWILSEQNADYIVDKEHILTYNLKVSPQLVEAYLKNTTGLDVQTNAAKLIV